MISDFSAIGRLRLRINVIKCFDVEEVRVDGVELVCDLTTTDRVIVCDLTIVSVGADGVIVLLGLQFTKLYQDKL